MRVKKGNRIVHPDHDVVGVVTSVDLERQTIIVEWQNSNATKSQETPISLRGAVILKGEI